MYIISAHIHVSHIHASKMFIWWFFSSLKRFLSRKLCAIVSMHACECEGWRGKHQGEKRDHPTVQERIFVRDPLCNCEHACMCVWELKRGRGRSRWSQFDSGRKVLRQGPSVPSHACTCMSVGYTEEEMKTKMKSVCACACTREESGRERRSASCLHLV